MQNDIRIVEGVVEIHKIFGYKKDTDYISDLGAQNSYGSRLRFLTFIFMELVAKGEERMFMSFMMAKVVGAIAKKKFNTPTELLSYLNDTLTNDELEEIFATCGRASANLRGGDMSRDIKEILKELKDGKEDK